MVRGHVAEQNLGEIRRDTMATVKTSNEPETIAAEPNGAVPPSASDVVKLDISDPTFMATAYDTYDELREKGRVTRVKFGSDDDGKSRRARGIGSSTARHSSSPITTTSWPPCSTTASRSIRVLRLTAEQREHDETPEEFRPFARSIISIDPPDHTRIRKLVQPSFTGRGMEAMRPSIQKIVDDLLDTAEREAEARGETPAQPADGADQPVRLPLPGHGHLRPARHPARGPRADPGLDREPAPRRPRTRRGHERAGATGAARVHRLPQGALRAQAPRADRRHDQPAWS